MAKRKMNIPPEARLRGLKKLVKSKKVNEGMKKWARGEIKRLEKKVKK